MARTSRNPVSESSASSSPPPPPPTSSDVDALDDLDLDDMFEGGDDSLFAGLDIDLDGMGEITDGGLVNVDVNAATNAALFVEPAPALTRSPTSSKRKKSKQTREEEEEYSPTKKKKRKSSTSKSGGSLKKKKKKSTTTANNNNNNNMPPPTSTPMVGQFGSSQRPKQRYAPLMARPIVPKQAAAAATTQPNQPELSTFCGLHPSSTMFYPYMPSLPVEPSMKRSHKMFVTLDSIYSIINSSSSSSSSGAASAMQQQQQDIAPAKGALFQLLSDVDTETTPHKKAALWQGIDTARKIAQSDNKNTKLVHDLRSSLNLIQKQHLFLQQNLENMQRYCQSNFNLEDYESVFGPTVQSRLAGLSGTVIRVKVQCTGFKEPKMSAVLVAHLPFLPKPPPPPPPAAAATTKSREKKSSKKRKSETEKSKTVTTTSAITSSSSTTTTMPAPPTPALVDDKPKMLYKDLHPFARQERIVEAISKRAREMEQMVQHQVHRQTSRILPATTVVVGSPNAAEDDEEEHIIHSAGLWKWLEQSTYFASFTKQDVMQILHCAWQPEQQQPRSGLVNTKTTRTPPRVVVQRDNASSVEEEKKTKVTNTCPNLFERLQSLLVVEEGSDDEDDETEDTTDDDSDSEFNDWHNETNNNHNKKDKVVLDLSALTLDERAYIHLKSVGLIPTKDNDDDTTESEPPAWLEQNDNEEEEEDELLSLEQAMKNDLVELEQVNNKRTALLQSDLLGYLQTSKAQQEEYNNQVVARYNLLLKKQKENKKSARQKTAKKDWVPW